MVPAVHKVPVVVVLVRTGRDSKHLEELVRVLREEPDKVYQEQPDRVLLEETVNR
jgi:hypothetical protein